jgi:hypothetical protein
MKESRPVYQGLDEKPYDSSYLHFDTVIETPVAKVWPQALKIGSYGKTRPWLMFDVLQFTDLGGRTRLTFLMIDVQLGKEGAPESQHEGVGQMIRGYFENLKRLVATSG